MSLLAPEALRDRLDRVRLLDVRQDAAAYAAGHLPGALHADLNRDLSAALEPGHDPAKGGRHPLPPLDRFTRLLGAWGIGPGTEVVAYDAASGANAAARLWWMLRAIGHTQVRVLDGGLQAAVAAGLPLDQAVPVPQPVAPYPATGWAWPTLDLDGVARLREDPSRRLLDVRAAERWRGEVETLDPIAGHIPGSLNLPYAENLGPDGRFKTPEALRAQYESLLEGLAPERLVVHCGSGVTACHTLLALEVAGLPGAALYVGSWSEWCRSGQPRVP